jgi:hypothetical protein
MNPSANRKLIPRRLRFVAIFQGGRPKIYLMNACSIRIRGRVPAFRDRGFVQFSSRCSVGALGIDAYITRSAYPSSLRPLKVASSSTKSVIHRRRANPNSTSAMRYFADPRKSVCHLDSTLTPQRSPRSTTILKDSKRGTRARSAAFASSTRKKGTSASPFDKATGPTGVRLNYALVCPATTLVCPLWIQPWR